VSKFLENFIIVKNENLDLFLKISKFSFFDENCKILDNIHKISKLKEKFLIS